MTPPPEFSRPERVDAIGEAERPVAVEATAPERDALARRFGLLSLDRLSAEFAVRRTSAGVRARGRVRAAAAQACSVTGEPVPAIVDEPVDLLFVETLDGADEVELDAGALDTVTYDGGAVDLGEAAAETVALALDPFPRAPGAADALKAAGVLSEDEAGPFGQLAGLKARLEGR